MAAPKYRLILPTLHEIVEKTPDRIWASVPIDEDDLSKGYKEINYASLLNAVNHAAKWLKEHIQMTERFETWAYAGQKDLRYPILVLAVAKIRAKVLLPSPVLPPAALIHLLKTTNCRVFLHDASTSNVVQQIVADFDSTIRPVLVPELSSWLNSESAEPTPWTVPYKEAKDDPWIIFHTAGTTGFPKPITYTHCMMSSMDAERNIQNAVGTIYGQSKGRWYTPLPNVHVVGMYSTLPNTILLGTTIVLGPSKPGFLSPATIAQVVDCGRVDAVTLVPALIEGIASSPAGLSLLRSLKFIYFGGAPLNPSTAHKLIGHTTLRSAFGSTEAGPYYMMNRSPDQDWEWLEFRDRMGLEFRPVGDGLFEGVFVRKPELEHWQQIFKTFPHLQEYPTKDLFVPHSNPEQKKWKFAGRADDMIVLSSGQKLLPTPIEARISQHPKVGGVIVGGQGREKPFLLVQWKGDESDEEKMDALWPVIEEANDGAHESLKLTKKLTLFVPVGKELVKTAKGEVARRSNELAYKLEIDTLYGRAG